MALHYLIAPAISLFSPNVFFSPSHKSRDYVRGGAEGALVPPEFGGSERRTERETDNLLLLAPPESKS